MMFTQAKGRHLVPKCEFHAIKILSKFVKAIEILSNLQGAEIYLFN